VPYRNGVRKRRIGCVAEKAVLSESTFEFARLRWSIQRWSTSVTVHKWSTSTVSEWQIGRVCWSHAPQGGIPIVKTVERKTNLAYSHRRLPGR
tara:strand:- start:104 stop:382 length:279 start_codon:yes stop_codon:yes gene_type:complete